MIDTYSVALSTLVKEFNLTILHESTDYASIRLTVEDVARPGLQLTGFFDHYEPMRLQIMGNVEMSYMSRQEPETRRRVYDRLFSYKFPAMLIARGIQPDADLMAMAIKHNITLLGTTSGTSNITSSIIAFLRDALAPRISRHGVLVEAYGEGVLIIGESGIGIINVAKLFGIGAIKLDNEINLVVNIVPWNTHENYDRLGLEDHYTEILGVNVPMYTIPITPGRYLAMIIEVADMYNRQRRIGFNAALEFTDQINRHFDENAGGM